MMDLFLSLNGTSALQALTKNKRLQRHGLLGIQRASYACICNSMPSSQNTNHQNLQLQLFWLLLKWSMHRVSLLTQQQNSGKKLNCGMNVNRKLLMMKSQLILNMTYISNNLRQSSFLGTKYGHHMYKNRPNFRLNRTLCRSSLRQWLQLNESTHSNFIQTARPHL